MRAAILAALTAAQLCAATAFADDTPDTPAKTGSDTAPDATPKRKRNDQLELRVGSAFIRGTQGDVTLSRADANVGLAYLPSGVPLVISTEVHLGPTFVDIDGEVAEALRLHANAVQWTNLSLEASVRIALYRSTRLHVEIFSDIETSALDDRLSFRRADIGTDQGTFTTTSFAERELELRYGWNRISGGMLARYRIGAFTPRLKVGFQRMFFQLTAELGDEAKTVLAGLNPDYAVLERSYERSFTTVILGPGLEYHTSEKVSLVLDGLYMPADGGAFWGGDLGLRLQF